MDDLPQLVDVSNKDISSSVQNSARELAGDLPQRYRAIFWIIASAVGMLRAVDTRFSVPGDGLRYIEMGDAYFRHDWKMAINSYWSPLYSWLIALPRYILKIPLRFESESIHLVNYGIYICVLFSFELFLKALLDRDTNRSGMLGLLEPYAIRLVAYSIFIYSVLNWLSTDQVTPDLCVECVVFLITATIIRIGRDGVTWARFALLGLLFGVGYLTKVFLLPLSFIFLLASLVAAGDFRKSVPRALLSFIIFMAICFPYVFALSHTKGRFVYGDAGKLAYAILVDGLPALHWQGEARVPGVGHPIHPTRKLMSDPPLFEFAEPIKSSYPSGYDPSYWYEGYVPRFDLRGELVILRKDLYFLYDLIFSQGEFLAAFFTVLLLGSGIRRFAQNLVTNAHFWLPAGCAIAAYSLILLETRYLSGFLIILWVAAFDSVSVPRSARKLVWYVALAVVLIVSIRILRSAVVEGGHILSHQKDANWAVAEELGKLGVEPGSKVASIGFSFEAYWAHLAGVTIVAEIPEGGAGAFWVSEPDVKARVYKVLSEYGARAVVSNRAPAYTTPPGWTKVDNSEFFVLRLDQ